jgi:hypothetical protein
MLPGVDDVAAARAAFCQALETVAPAVVAELRALQAAGDSAGIAAWGTCYHLTHGGQVPAWLCEWPQVDPDAEDGHQFDVDMALGSWDVRRETRVSFRRRALAAIDARISELELRAEAAGLVPSRTIRLNPHHYVWAARFQVLGERLADIATFVWAADNLRAVQKAVRGVLDRVGIDRRSN